MAKKLSRATRKAMGITLSPQTGKWISYRLKVAEITHEQVATQVVLYSSNGNTIFKWTQELGENKTRFSRSFGLPRFFGISSSTGESSMNELKTS